MCGIVVGMSFGKLDEEKEAQRQAVLKILTTELLLQTEERGKDAVGAGLLFDDGRYFGIKRGDRAGEFLAKFATSKEYFGGLLKVWDQHKEPCRVYLGHCRKGTGGDKTDNANNHPIKIKNLVGIHNGMLRNDDEIFEKLGCKRDGQVDSEAIFRLFDYCTNHGAEPFTNEMLIEVANRLDGEYAITLFNADNREQVPFIRYRRPVEFILLRELGIVLAISELKFWSTVHFKYERMVNYYKNILKLDLPNFLNTDLIDKKAMGDDTVGIFDLTKEVDEKTKIEDLFEDKRIIGAKKWKATYTSTGTSYNNRSGGSNLYGGHDWHRRNRAGYNGGTGTTSTTTKNENKSNVKARVFNKITRKYEVKEGDKVVDEDKSIALAVGKSDTITNIDDNKNVSSVGLFNPDNATEKKSSDTSSEMDLEDLTTYTPDPRASKNDDDEDDLHFEGEEPDTIDAQFRVVKEVDMEEEDEIPPEIMEQARNAYNQLPTNKRGYTDIDDILNSLDVQGEAVLRRLGPKFLANRVAHDSWIRGYAAALMAEKDKEEKPTTNTHRKEEKDRRREKYIFGLKRMLMMMVYAMQDSKKEESHDLFQSHISGQLAQIALNSSDEIDVTAITELFTDYEQSKLRDVIDVIQNAEEYKSAGSSNKN